MRTSHPYSNLSKDEYEELFSNYLINSWSYSRVSAFSRNEKAFEMSYIYNERSKVSASTIAGQAYHESLELYFRNKSENKDELDLVALQEIAYSYIMEVKSTVWKIQKTTPTIEDCQKKAVKIITSLLENFFKEKSTYDCQEILYVEEFFNEFLTINGVDIPLPCNAKIDQVVRSNEGKIVIIDHKSKNSFSDEKELGLLIGKQAVTYYKCLEAKTGIKADEVWFVENKYSKNRDGSDQLNCFIVGMDKDTVRLYESLLYEPLKRMIEAVSDPNYVYMINDSDNFVDKADLHVFWTKTMISEIDDFNIPQSKKEMVSRRLKKIRDESIANIDPSVIKKFKQNASEFIQYNLADKNMTRSEKIEHILRSLSLLVKVEHVFEGYSSDKFLLQVSAGTNISKIFRYKLDIANALGVSSIRIDQDLVVYEEKSYVSVEASKKREKDLIFDSSIAIDQKIPVGMDNLNQPVYWDLNNHSTPHILTCGATGSGKSVFLRSTIEYAISLGVKDIVIFDPKFEFLEYNSTPNVTVVSDIDDVESKMEYLVSEMNYRVKKGRESKTLIIFDEFADAVASAKKGRELYIYENKCVGMYANGEPKMKREKVGEKNSLEQNLKMLLQKGRSCGFRIVAATQRASVKVITGDAKVNFPVQICFRVPKEIDSKVVLGESGAESLAGKGDGLINSPEYMGLVRFQAFYKK